MKVRPIHFWTVHSRTVDHAHQLTSRSSASSALPGRHGVWAMSGSHLKQDKLRAAFRRLLDSPDGQGLPSRRRGVMIRQHTQCVEQVCDNSPTRSTPPLLPRWVTLQHTGSVRPIEGLQGQRSAQSGFRPDIEGLRAVAVLAVVLFHAGLPGVNGGFIGVDVFFVVSGFLITVMLWRDVASLGTVRRLWFYAARPRRLLPAAAIVLVVTAVGSV